MKNIKSGQLCTINNRVYRAKKKLAGCKGCFFECSFFLCPGMLDGKTKTKKIDCQLNNIILEKVGG